MKFESIVKITTGVGLALLAGMATIQTVKEYRTKTGIFEEETETVEEVDTTEESEQSEGPDVEIIVNKPKFLNKETLIKAGIIAALSLVAGFVIAVKDKVRTIVEETEYKRSVGEEVNQAQVVGRVGLALAPTVLVGTASILSILGSYHVLTNRNSILAPKAETEATLATASGK